MNSSISCLQASLQRRQWTCAVQAALQQQRLQQGRRPRMAREHIIVGRAPNELPLPDGAHRCTCSIFCIFWPSPFMHSGFQQTLSLSASGLFHMF